MADKKIKLNLVGLDGNAFALLGAFQNQARKEGWTDEEINVVSAKARSGDYNNLLRVLSNHTEDEEEKESDEECDDCSCNCEDCACTQSECDDCGCDNSEGWVEE